MLIRFAEKWKKNENPKIISIVQPKRCINYNELDRLQKANTNHPQKFNQRIYTCSMCNFYQHIISFFSNCHLVNRCAFAQKKEIHSDLFCCFETTTSMEIQRDIPFDCVSGL